MAPTSVRLALAYFWMHPMYSVGLVLFNGSSLKEVTINAFWVAERTNCTRKWKKDWVDNNLHEIGSPHAQVLADVNDLAHGLHDRWLLAPRVDHNPRRLRGRRRVTRSVAFGPCGIQERTQLGSTNDKMSFIWHSSSKAPVAGQTLTALLLMNLFESLLKTIWLPPITYYWTVLLILDHSYLVGKSIKSKMADTKVSGF